MATYNGYTFANLVNTCSTEYIYAYQVFRYMPRIPEVSINRYISLPMGRAR